MSEGQQLRGEAAVSDAGVEGGVQQSGTPGERRQRFATELGNGRGSAITA
jgi:hypothetical protein